ncbi:MAG: GNAT family N-acetyltransferase [Euryarchaeota archaeon]|nr:GNAT family N-acetyltransferase [Euryarchaeota archaeon]MDE1835434.1 GNAT family N-acetyltransferase [Euryarchaeota archaeon]MDE2046085.1 GNAT family N-acetyltransferase [Thermoplasmata archaeon]
MEVRAYRPRDAKACVELFHQLTEVHRKLYDDPTIGSKDPARSFRAQLREHGPGNSWVAVHRGRVVGLTGLVPHRGWSLIEPVVVLEGFRRRGVARLLITTVVEEARRRHLDALLIKPVARNTAALRTFHALGFRALGQVELLMPLRGKGWFKPVPGPTLAGRRFQRWGPASWWGSSAPVPPRPGDEARDPTRDRPLSPGGPGAEQVQGRSIGLRIWFPHSVQDPS